MGWVDAWVGAGLVGLGQVFFQFSVGWLGWVHYSKSAKKIERIMLNHARLDKFWLHQAVKFDFTTDLTGTGNRSVLCIKIRHY